MNFPHYGKKGCPSFIAMIGGFAVNAFATIEIATPVAPEQLSTPARMVSQSRRLDDLERSWEERSRRYLEDIQKISKKEVWFAQKEIAERYKVALQKQEDLQRQERQRAIAVLEKFLQNHPESLLTPDAIFRLAELYFDRTNDHYLLAMERYDEDFRAYVEGRQSEAPVEPRKDYRRNIELYQRIVSEFPDYRYADSANYLLGFCLFEQGEEEQSANAFQDLVNDYPESKFVAESYTRIGEYYFGIHDMKPAIRAYEKASLFPSSSFYDKALYKLGWAYYRLSDYRHSIEAFDRLIQYADRKAKEGGGLSAGELRKEALRYLAIGLADSGDSRAARTLFQSLGQRDYQVELIRTLADIYLEQENFPQAVETLKVMLAEFPTDIDNPAIQQKLVEVYDRMGDAGEANRGREQMAVLFGPGSLWYNAHRQNTHAIQEAQHLAQESLFIAATNHHILAQKTKDPQEYRTAADYYQRYLKQYPNSPRAYELMFFTAESYFFSAQYDKAQLAYLRVVESDDNNQYLSDAAFARILSFEKWIEQVDGIPIDGQTDRPDVETIQVQEIPRLKQRYAGACDYFARILPDHERAPEILFHGADVYFRYGHFAEARKRFELVIKRYPRHQVAVYSGNLIIDSYRNEKNWSAVEAWGSELASNQMLMNAERSGAIDEWKRLSLGAIFKAALALENAGQWLPAAKEYLRLYRQNPDSEFADKALYNAALNLGKMGKLRNATVAFRKLTNRYPKSELAPRAQFRLAFDEERLLHFDAAVIAYEQLAKNYPSAPEAPDGLVNAAILRAALGDHIAAAKHFADYPRLYPEKADAGDILFRAALAYEKAGLPNEAQRLFEDYLKRKDGKPDRQIEAHVRLATIFEKKRMFKEWEHQLRKAIDRYTKDRREAIGILGLSYAAEASFRLMEPQFRIYEGVTFRSANAVALKKTLSQKAKLLAELQQGYIKVVALGQIDWAIAALYQIGLSFQRFSESLIAAPIPKGLSAEDEDLYRSTLEEQALPIEEKAIAAYSKCLEKAKEAKASTPWSQKAWTALSKVRPGDYQPPIQDAVVYSVGWILSPSGLFHGNHSVK